MCSEGINFTLTPIITIINEYDEDYFLNPIEAKDIEDYFVYDELTLEILPKHKEGTEAFQKANYMNKILDLNHKKLIRMREKVERNGPYEKHEKLLPPFYSIWIFSKLMTYDGHNIIKHGTVRGFSNLMPHLFQIQGKFISWPLLIKEKSLTVKKNKRVVKLKTWARVSR